MARQAPQRPQERPQGLPASAPERAFEPAILERRRAPVKDCKELVPVNDPKAWELVTVCPGGPWHVWRHRETYWLSQTLTVPRWALEAPERARDWLTWKGVGDW